MSQSITKALNDDSLLSTAPIASAMDRDWLAVAASTLCLVFSVGSMTLYCFGVFVGPLRTEFGWSRTQTFGALTVSQYTLALALPIWGILADRFGPRTLIPLSYVTLSLTLGSLAILSPHLWHLYLVFALIPFFAGGATPLGTNAVLVRRFHRHLGLSMGISLMGVGLGAAFLPPLAQRLVSELGWRHAFVVLGAIVLIFGLPAAFIATRNTRGRDVIHQHAEAVAIMPMVMTRAFLVMCTVFLLLGSVSVGTLVTLIPMLTDRGFTAASAARMAGIAGLMALIARAFVGWILDRFYAPRVMAVFAVIATLGFLLLAFLTGQTATLAATVCLGLVMGGEIDCIGFLVRRYFPQQAFGRLYGIAFGLCLVGTGSGPLILSLSYDHFGGYHAGLLLFAATSLVCGVLTLAMPRYKAATY